MDAASLDPAPDGPAMPYSAIVLPVPEADTMVRARLLQVQPELLPRDRSTAARITLLAPFYPPEQIDDAVIRELGEFFADLTPFALQLTGVSEFPTGIAYLSPEPAGLLRRIIHELHRLFPEFPPYGGAFDDIVPHLTLARTPGEDTEALRSALAGTLPLDALATTAALVQVAADDTRLLAALPFGTSAA